ncbi:MAG: hypothetical protein BGO68_01800 [Candidatus Amoebophilus sp. 36-38]|nr:MAG: hypothetical protein BGO68_01800 [Candidatus Amoebophilus sp. 36-38]
MRFKDRSIIQLLEKLKVQLEFENLSIVDYWEADTCAIGLKKDNKLVYISTYNGVINNKEEYDYDLEIFDNLKYDNSKTIELGRNVTRSKLIQVIKRYFNH